MKKIVFVFMIALCSQLSNAQIQFGVKAGINYNSDSFSNVTNDVFSGAKSKSGYHVGVWTRAKLFGIYIRPELVYTQLKNEVVYSSNPTTQKSTTYTFNKIDIPILFGKKILGFANVFAGPSFQYALSSKFGLSDITEVKVEDFTMGLQFGAGVDLGRIGIDIRWERSLSGTETSFLDSTVTNGSVNFDTRVNQIIVGLSYRL
ncbi:MAG: PorT family protein [Flavobacteriaceae bacterium]